MGAIGLVSFWLLRRMTTERLAPAVASEKQKFNYFATLKSFFKNKPMMGATISTVAYLALMMTVTTSMPYVFMCYFQNTKLITIASMLAGCPIALGIVLAKPMLKNSAKAALHIPVFTVGSFGRDCGVCKNKKSLCLDSPRSRFNVRRGVLPHTYVGTRCGLH